MSLSQHATQEIAALRPDFMSVTYGAGGGTSEHTVNIAADLKKKYDVTVLTHLTCVSSTREHVAAMVKKYKDAGIENILALRGDIPEGGAPHSDYHYAAELVRDIKSQGDFCVGGACYPEGHVEAANKTEDILHLKEKVDAGCEFLTTRRCSLITTSCTTSCTVSEKRALRFRLLQALCR